MFQNYKTKTLKKDILSGIIVALVSIPISMGYAQVAGLPVVYGLYGSLLPILVFSLITSSPQFVFGVDATPAALVGATLASLGIVTGSGEAIRLVPVIIDDAHYELCGQSGLRGSGHRGQHFCGKRHHYHR